MRRFLAVVVVSAGLLAGLVLATGTASAASSVGWCDGVKIVPHGDYGHTRRYPMHSATGSLHCTLARGASGSAVRALQMALKQCNYAPNLDVDGDFGDKTEAALRHAQDKKGVDDDGIYGPITGAALAWMVWLPTGKPGVCYGGIR